MILHRSQTDATSYLYRKSHWNHMILHCSKAKYINTIARLGHRNHLLYLTFKEEDFTYDK